MIRPPRFWSADPAAPGLAPRLLTPLSLLWIAAAAGRRAAASPKQSPIPVVCVGNLSVGGAGKTPLVMALTQGLRDRGVGIHVVTRGYGGRERGPRRVDPARDAASEVGDEPLLLAPWAPTWVARDRAAGVAAAAEAGAEVALLDDGLQNPSVTKDLSILAVDAGAGFGNGRVMPAGPLREPVTTGLRKVGWVVLIGDDAQASKALSDWPELHGPNLLRARLEPLATGLPLKGSSVVAFAGIGRPGKFFDTIRGLGADLIAAHPFPDHHVYPPAILRRMLSEARGSGAMLVTTEKDAVRLPAAFRPEALALPIRLAFDDGAAAGRLMDEIAVLAARRKSADHSRGKA